MGAEVALTWEENGADLVWSHPDIPYLQFARIDVIVGAGEVITMFSQSDDGSDSYGLHCTDVESCLRSAPAIPGSIQRIREVSELPLGRITSVEQVADTTGSVLELRLVVAGEAIEIVSGEISEGRDGGLQLVRLEQNLLVALKNNP